MCTSGNFIAMVHLNSLAALNTSAQLCQYTAPAVPCRAAICLHNAHDMHVTAWLALSCPRHSVTAFGLLKVFLASTSVAEWHCATHLLQTVVLLCSAGAYKGDSCWAAMAVTLGPSPDSGANFNFDENAKDSCYYSAYGGIANPSFTDVSTKPPLGRKLRFILETKPSKTTN